jgi:hypothetical protein
LAALLDAALAERLAVLFLLFAALPFGPAFDLTVRFALPRAMGSLQFR